MRSGPKARRAAARCTGAAARSRARAGESPGSRTTARTRARRCRTRRGKGAPRVAHAAARVRPPAGRARGRPARRRSAPATDAAPTLPTRGSPSRRRRSPPTAPQRTRPSRSRAAVAGVRSGASRGRPRRARNYPVPVAERRDVGVVLSGGGVNGVLMEPGFLKRLRDGPLWERIAVVFGTSSGAVAGLLAALDRLDDLERFLLALRPEETFRPIRLWRLPFLGFHDYALPDTIHRWFGDFEAMVTQLREAPVEPVGRATDVTADHRDEGAGLELVRSSRTTQPDEMAQAILASAAISALVMPLRVGDRIATDGAWVRNFPLGHAYDHAEVEAIVAFRYFPTYPRLGVEGFRQLRGRLERFGRIPPVRALMAELDDAMRRAERGEPAHLGDVMVRLARVAILRNTLLEERFADDKGAAAPQPAVL